MFLDNIFIETPEEDRGYYEHTLRGVFETSNGIIFFISNLLLIGCINSLTFMFMAKASFIGYSIFFALASIITLIRKAFSKRIYFWLMFIPFINILVYVFLNYTITLFKFIRFCFKSYKDLSDKELENEIKIALENNKKQNDRLEEYCKKYQDLDYSEEFRKENERTVKLLKQMEESTWKKK